MSRRSERELDTMLAYDGELEGDVRDPCGDPECAGILGGLDELSELVRGYLETETDAAGHRLSELWARVERGIEAPADDVPAAAASPARPPQRSRGRDAGAAGWGQRLWSFVVGHRGHLVTGLVGACAAALITMGVAPERTRVRTQVRTVAGPTAAVAPPVTAMKTVPVKAPPVLTEPAEIERMEVYQGSGTIVTVPGENGEPSTSVIWLTPEDTQDTMEGPI